MSDLTPEHQALYMRNLLARDLMHLVTQVELARADILGTAPELADELDEAFVAAITAMTNLSALCDTTNDTT